MMRKECEQIPCTTAAQPLHELLRLCVLLTWSRRSTLSFIHTACVSFCSTVFCLLFFSELLQLLGVSLHFFLKVGQRYHIDFLDEAYLFEQEILLNMALNGLNRFL